MPKHISNELKSHLSDEITSIANCWLITRTDGVVKAFTDHDADIIYQEQTYISIAGFNSSSIESKSDLSVDNLDVQGALHSDYLTAPDLMAGLYDFAKVEIFAINYNDTSQGKMILKRGIIGEVKLQKEQFVAEIRGVGELLQKNIGEVYSPICRATFCDNRCKLNPENFSFVGAVQSLTSQTIFTTNLTQDSGYFTNGVIEWTSGKNKGLKVEIKEYSNNQIILSLPMPYAINIGDEFSALAGCNKTIDTCIAKFNNAVNFRGEPYLPGTDEISKTSGTMTK